MNSLPENEGHTEFPFLNVSVQPMRNTAVVFCNVLDSGEADFRVCHCAKPVSHGWRKFGVNIWLTDANLSEYTFQPPLPIKNSYSKDDSKLVVRRAQCKYETWEHEQERRGEDCKIESSEQEASDHQETKKRKRI